MNIIIESIINYIIINIIYISNMKLNFLFISILFDKNYEILMKLYINIKIFKNNILMINIIQKKEIISFKNNIIYNDKYDK